jgi:hypothetical protein
VLVVSLYHYTLEFWNLYLNRIERVTQHLGKAPPIIGHGGRLRPEDGVFPQQRLKEIILEDIRIVADTIEGVSRFLDMRQRFKLWKNLSIDQDKLEAILRCFNFLRFRLERLLPAIQHHVDVVVLQQQVELAQTQLIESKKAIQQADTIKRLTILAFIFIPISTASSVFGMNVKELDPTPSVWVFIVVTIGLLSVTLLAASWHRLKSSWLSWKDSRYVWPRDTGSIWDTGKG